jgi:hypothetical protein
MLIWKFRIEFRYDGNVVKYFKNKPSVEDLVPIIDSRKIEIDNSDTKLNAVQTATVLIEKLSVDVFDWEYDPIYFKLEECELIDN